MMFNSNLKRESTANSNPAKKSHDHTAFQKQHALEFGLEITQRDPKTLKICSVRCQFCSFFGRDEVIGKERNRKQTENVKNWTSFRKEYYRDHHELNHGTRWSEYQRLNMADKDGYCSVNQGFTCVFKN
jgi:hypothetical protein